MSRLRSLTALLSIVFVLIAAAAHAQTDVSGDWEVAIQSPQGTTNIVVTFKQDGTSLSGLLKSQMGQMPFQNGTINGNDLTFAFTIPFQGAPLDITMNGKVDGSSIAGKAQFGGLADGDWTGKRIDAARAAALAAPPATPAAPARPSSSPSAAATGTGVTGKWEIIIKTPMGDVPAPTDLVESGGKITGSMSGPNGSLSVSGTFDGNAITLEFVAPTPQGNIPISMRGEFNGDAIVNGMADFGGMGQGEWSAKRIKQ